MKNCLRWQALKLYKEVSYKIDKVLVGNVTYNKLNINGKSSHFVARTIGSISQRRNGININDALATLTNPILIDPVLVDEKGRSQRFIGENLAITVNPDIGILIQVNPLKTRRK